MKLEFLIKTLLFYSVTGNAAVNIPTKGYKALRDGKSLLLSGHVSNVEYHNIDDSIGKYLTCYTIRFYTSLRLIDLLF